MRAERVAALALALALLAGRGGGQDAGAAPSEAPLSAIDWLSPSIVTPVTPAMANPAIDATPSLRNALPESVTSSPLGLTSPDAVGLLAPSRTGLAHDLWGMGRVEDISRAIAAVRVEGYPALQSLLLTLLLAEAEGASDSGPEGRLLLARIDKLLAMGALDQASSLMQAAGTGRSPEIFRRAFDVALLTGAEDRACVTLAASPGLAPALPARIFCLARNGDWDSAAVTLSTAEALGQISAAEAELLTRFLDPAIAEGAPPLPVPQPVTPLDLRLYEAIGEPLATTDLPLAFAHADLAEITGWKARLEAAERLSRAGAIAPNLLLGLYTLQKPAASGGVWDRVAAFQRFETAMLSGDPGAVEASLPPVWQALAQAQLEPVFAALFAETLTHHDLGGEAGAIATRMALLAGVPPRPGLEAGAGDARLAFALALASGSAGALTAPDALSGAVQAGLAPLAPLPPDLAALIEAGRLGEAVLQAMQLVVDGAGHGGRHEAISQGLAGLGAAGLPRAALQAGLELLLLDRGA